MISLVQIQNRLREEFNDLCDACAAEQEWLEEGDGSGLKGGRPDAGRNTVSGSANTQVSGS